MQQKTINKYERILDEIISRKITISEYCIETGQNQKTFYVQMNNIAKGAIKDIEVRERLLAKYERVKRWNHNSIKDNIQEMVENIDRILPIPDTSSGQEETFEEIETDDRAETSLIRDDEGRIKYYSYNIFRRDKSPLCGKLTREEMNTIYRLYSFYGDSLPQRIVSRHFPDLSLIDLKRILRAFNITKASAPFAPHMFEEKSEEELRSIQLREKENSFLRKAEEDVIKNNEKLLKKYAQENIELKKQLDTLSNLTVDIEKIEPYVPEKTNDNINVALNLYLSDVHLGATVETGTLFDENINYGKEEAQRRLSEIIDKLYNIVDCDTINLCLLGDNIDCCGHAGYTNSMSHLMPENMDPRDQFNSFIELYDWFVRSLYETFKCNINVYSVPTGNHSGSFEFALNTTLQYYTEARFPEASFTLFPKFFGVFKQNNNTFVLSHGKNDKFQKHGLPLNIDDKNKVKIYEWLDDNGLYQDNIHIIKGDLHSNNMNSCKRFTYRNVLSLFGASDYSSYGFSRNSYGLSYDIIINDQVISGTIENI